MHVRDVFRLLKAEDDYQYEKFGPHNNSISMTRVSNRKIHVRKAMSQQRTYPDNYIDSSRAGHRLKRCRERAQARQQPRRPCRDQRRDKARALVALERKRGQGEGESSR